jgi:uncharacterized membrane protein YeaQ/YmgE (transglycosylase-associated protein family)
MDVGWRHEASSVTDATGTAALPEGLDMHLLWSIFVGGVIGLGAGSLAPDRVADDLAPSALLGIVGALLADALAHTPGLYHPEDLLRRVIGPVLGGMIALATSHVVRRRMLRRTELGRWKASP